MLHGTQTLTHSHTNSAHSLTWNIGKWLHCVWFHYSCCFFSRFSSHLFALIFSQLMVTITTSLDWHKKWLYWPLVMWDIQTKEKPHNHPIFMEKREMNRTYEKRLLLKSSRSCYFIRKLSVNREIESILKVEKNNRNSNRMVAKQWERKRCECMFCICSVCTFEADSIGAQVFVYLYCGR